ncbi:glycosyltransferase [Arthrobacter sp. Alg241-R88]|uniref:glycosyltransferase n=1 Tax=Arthrobacter sp. Alg241-R88 TaxID=2305984 RepID=UPI0013D2FF84|nr:glycosyltransferase [Arthrobacter sp. Alg241-R88]
MTESFGGGVAAAIRHYKKNSPQAEHHLVYAPRDDAPIDAADLQGFASVTQMGSSHLGRILDLRRRLAAFDEVTIHAHSSFGGAYTRLSTAKSLKRRIVYTPHCYAFERQDIGLVKRVLFWLMEWALAFNTTLFAGCSEREVKLSRWPAVKAGRLMIPNIMTGVIAGTPGPSSDQQVVSVVGAGRLGPQKDPEFFARCIGELRRRGLDVSATWIGGGNPELEATLREEGVLVTGWLSSGEVQQHLRQADVYIHSALWEGFPLAVLEATALSVATVVRDIPAFEEVSEDLKLESALKILPHICRSQLDFAAWKQKNVSAWRSQLANNTDMHQERALNVAYEL